MDIEHCDCLSWFLRRGESHEQDGERLPSLPQTEAASSDPAMAFEPSIARTGDHSTRLESAAASLPDEQRIDPVSASKRASTLRAILSGEYPAARSTTCNALRRYGRGSRAAGDAGTRA